MHAKPGPGKPGKSTAKSKPQLSASESEVQRLSGKAGTIRLQIKLLEKRASELDAQARRLLWSLAEK
jgi:hypothetical protein